MNEKHALCGTPEWSAHMRDVVRCLTAHAELGASMLEIGPGPGAATEWLRHEVTRLVALELDEPAAAELDERYEGTNVDVAVGDAAALGYPDGTFDSVGCFTMLHHLPTVRLQNAILSEALRVLRPGGVLVASDSLPSTGLHEFHQGDVCNPVDPAPLIARLDAIGLERIAVVVDDLLEFIAHEPGCPRRQSKRSRSKRRMGRRSR